MTERAPSDWDTSADAWIAHMGDAGDTGRGAVLDPPMLEAVKASKAQTALDVGCGEGRFCRMMTKLGVTATGLDPTKALLEAARERDPGGTYVDGSAEALPFADKSFDLVVSYLSLIDIPDFRAGIREMARVLKTGGTLLVANLTPHATAIPRDWPEGKGGWVWQDETRLHYAMDDYAVERSYWTAWSGIRIVNHHRPLSAYMDAFLTAGLTLCRYDEPPYLGDNPDQADKFRRAPWFNLMVWRKPEPPVKDRTA